jgi:hypothetical protein
LDFIFGDRSVLHQTLIEVQPSGAQALARRLDSCGKPFASRDLETITCPRAVPIKESGCLPGKPQPKKSNITDNESAKMKTSKGVIQGYDGVTTVDSKHQVIVHAEAFGEAHG